MMKTINGLVGLCGLAAVCVLAVGCDRARELSEKEALERSTRLYSNAMDDYRAGRLEAAIKGFERVVHSLSGWSCHIPLYSRRAGHLQHKSNLTVQITFKCKNLCFCKLR